MLIKKKVREFVHASKFRISKEALPALEEATRMILRKAMSYSKPYKTVRSVEIFLALRPTDPEKSKTKKRRAAPA